MFPRPLPIRKNDRRSTTFIWLLQVGGGPLATGPSTRESGAMLLTAALEWIACDGTAARIEAGAGRLFQCQNMGGSASSWIPVDDEESQSRVA